MICLMRKAWAVILLSCVSVSSCGGGTSSSTIPRADGCEPPHPDEPHSLEVFLAVSRNAGPQRPLCPGARLEAEDSLWVTVELDTASQVRMVYSAADGESGELLRQDEADLTRRAVFRAPQGLLVRSAGQAELLIVASREPLAEADPEMGGMLDVIRDTGTLVDRDGSLRPPPPGVETASAGGLDLGAQGLHADFDENGVAILSLTLTADRE